MYDQLSAPSQHATSITDFADAYRAAFDTATGTILRAGKPGSLKDGHIDVPIAVTTRVFGTMRARLRLPITGSEDKARIAWSSNLTFPGVAPGTVPTRDTHLPLRADLDARDG